MDVRLPELQALLMADHAPDICAFRRSTRLPIVPSRLSASAATTCMCACAPRRPAAVGACAGTHSTRRLSLTYCRHRAHPKRSASLSTLPTLRHRLWSRVSTGHRIAGRSETSVGHDSHVPAVIGGRGSHQWLHAAVSAVERNQAARRTVCCFKLLLLYFDDVVMIFLCD